MCHYLKRTANFLDYIESSFTCARPKPMVAQYLSGLIFCLDLSGRSIYYRLLGISETDVLLYSQLSRCESLIIDRKCESGVINN